MNLDNFMPELSKMHPFEEKLIQVKRESGFQPEFIICKYFLITVGENIPLKIYIIKDFLSMNTEFMKDKDAITEKKIEIVTNNERMLDLIDFCLHVAKSDAPILIQGETGTGKEMFANLIHNHSNRKDKPFIKINCAAIPETLLESELFGYVKGAFTGAYTDRPGRFELANRGTIFLDEIGEMSPALQAKLLRVLEHMSFERLGSNKTIKVDVRVISATNKDLREEIKRGTFREDLYYRISVIPINIPPLRERKEDIPILINHFLKEFEFKGYKKIDKVDAEALNALINYNWPGNIRELKNVIEYAIVCAKDNIITIDCLPKEIKSSLQKCEDNDKKIAVFDKNNLTQENKKIKKKPHRKVSLDECIKVLEECGFNKSLAAKILNIDRSTLYRKLKNAELKI